MHSIQQMPDHSRVVNGRLDLLGASLSLLCLLHCSLLPFLPLLLAVAPWLGDETVHRILLSTLAPIALISLFVGYRDHRRQKIIWLGGCGLLALIAAIFLGETLEKPMTMMGSLVLSAAHLLNRKAGQMKRMSQGEGSVCP